MEISIFWRSVLLPIIVFTALVIYDEKVTTPSCRVIHDTKLGEEDAEGYYEEDDENTEDLKVMIVANLLLLGSDAGYVNLYFRDYYLSKFFRKSVESLNPDILLILGDISAKGFELTKSKWSSVLQQFHGLMEPFIGLPFHAILGDRDVGQCSNLSMYFVNQIASKFPGLDSSGCGAFDINNISFVSLNAVSLLCGNNNLRYSVEKAIEMESIDMQMEIKVAKHPSRVKENFDYFDLRENAMSAGSGPVLLLHFPLYRTADSSSMQSSTTNGIYSNSVHSAKKIMHSGIVGAEPYDLWQTLPLNASEYILQALRPRIVFSAHSHDFCVHTHSDGTPEVTIPAMTWDVRDDPGFILATFRKNRRLVTISYCSLARESHILVAYIAALLLLTYFIFVPHTLPPRINSK